MLRSIQKAWDIVKQDDPETAITVHTIRTWCKEGKIKSLYAGNKVLVDMDSLLEYISPNKN
ncbi:MAG: helix-turn-helix domain-containing protein [Roseburia sp.]|nr:helix-turn-helix domain-containing protein [Roseburia sp.]